MVVKVRYSVMTAQMAAEHTSQLHVPARNGYTFNDDDDTSSGFHSFHGFHDMTSRDAPTPMFASSLCSVSTLIKYGITHVVNRALGSLKLPKFDDFDILERVVMTVRAYIARRGAMPSAAETRCDDAGTLSAYAS